MVDLENAVSGTCIRWVYKRRTGKKMKKMKRFQAIFFDWDGTAVVSRTAPAEDVVDAMRPLLEQGVRLCIISGTTYENIASGKLHVFFDEKSFWNCYGNLVMLFY